MLKRCTHHRGSPAPTCVSVWVTPDEGQARQKIRRRSQRCRPHEGRRGRYVGSQDPSGSSAHPRRLGRMGGRTISAMPITAPIATTLTGTSMNASSRPPCPPRVERPSASACPEQLGDMRSRAGLMRSISYRRFRSAVPSAACSQVARSCASLARRADSARFRPATMRLASRATRTKMASVWRSHGDGPSDGKANVAPNAVRRMATNPADPVPQWVATMTAR